MKANVARVFRQSGLNIHQRVNLRTKTHEINHALSFGPEGFWKVIKVIASSPYNEMYLPRFRKA